jgi:hypothetical protein
MKTGLAHREEDRLRVLENTVLRGIFVGTYEG